MKNFQSNIKINGFTDSRTCCDRCGKTGLKGTWNIDTADGNYFLGSSCIKKGWQMTQPEFTAKVNSDKSDRLSKAKKEFNASLEGRFYREYIGSDKHGQDIRNFGFGYVLKLIKPATDLRNQICENHNVKFV